MNILIIIGAKYLYLAAAAIVVIYTLIQPREKQKKILIFAFIALPIAYLVSRIGALLYYDPRPFVVGHVTPLIPHAPDNGFPSDHALLTSALAAIITRFSWRTGAVLWLIAILVGISRVAAEIHHPIDIIGSIVISVATITAVYFFLKRISRKQSI